jgi:membrane fusion protein, multidrug efflux system
MTETIVDPHAAPGPAQGGGSRDPHSPRARVRAARRAFLVLGVIVGALLVAVAVYLIRTQGQVRTDNAQIDADVVPIAARTDGQVVAMLVHDNQEVRKGDPILKLDDSDRAAKVSQAEGELVVAKAQLDAAGNQEKVAGAALERALADSKRAELDLGRVQQLKDAGAGTQQRLDDAQSASDVARASVAQARAAVAAARAQSASAQGRVEAAQAALALTRNQLAYTTVMAPADGVVSDLSVHEGQIISPGQPIGELIPNDIYVVANFKETQVGDMRPGDHAEIKVDALRGRTFEGEVESVSGGTGARFSMLPPDNATGNFVKVVQRVPVRIRWLSPRDGLSLQAGLSAQVTVFIGSGAR